MIPHVRNERSELNNDDDSPGTSGGATRERRLPSVFQRFRGNSRGDVLGIVDPQGETVTLDPVNIASDEECNNEDCLGTSLELNGNNKTSNGDCSVDKVKLNGNGFVDLQH